MSVVGTATNSASALSVCIRERPDVVLLNFSMADVEVTVSARRIRASVPACRIIVLSADELPLLVLDLIRSAYPAIFRSGPRITS